ncbi:MAG: hydroxyacid dehydrogenase [Methylobacteriaceae bacterium]|nr:hydroxyacid dehydrogenase [Methylobacteriaceae bacterium]
MTETRFRLLVTSSEMMPAGADMLNAIGAAIETMPGKVTEARLIETLATPTRAMVMRGNPPITRAVLDAAAPHLKVIAKPGAGVDSVDLKAATDHGIPIMTAGHGNAPAVAEITIGFMLALGRDIVRLDVRTRRGDWRRDDYNSSELAGRTLGLVGFGRIGKRVAELARAFGMRVVVLTRTPANVAPGLAEVAESLDALLRDADYVSLHCPLNEATRGLMGRAAIAAMRKGAFLINTGRGALVDEAALAEALASGHLAGAALDTLSEEPPPPDNPLLAAPNLILTPHIAGLSTGATQRTGLTTAENIIAVLTGGRIGRANVANPDVLERLGVRA